MSGIGREAAVFLCAVFSGGVAALAYHMVIVLRRVIRHSFLAANLEDVLYWICSGGYLFYQMYCTTYGVVRWHFILGVVIGFLLAKYTCYRLGKVFLKLQKRLEKPPKNK